MNVAPESSPSTSDPAAADIRLKTLYEDDFLLIVDKPRGIHSSKLYGSEQPALADVLLQYLPALADAGEDPLEAGLTHRLDYWTAGLLIVAKKRSAWEQGSEALLRLPKSLRPTVHLLR